MALLALDHEPADAAPPVAVRTLPRPPGDRRPLVVIHYTAFAPRLAHTPSSSPACWATFSGCTPVQAVRRVLERIEADAGRVLAIANRQGEVLLYSHRPETAAAIINQGLTLDDVQTALIEIRRGRLS